MRKNCILSLLFLLSISESNAQNIAGFGKDIIHFQNTLQRVHVNPFHTISEERFHTMTDSLIADSDTLTRVQFNIRLMEILAGIGDMHTNMGFYASHKLPMAIFKFEEGYFVRAVSNDHASILGKQITHLNGYKIELIFDKLKNITSVDNEMGYLVNGLNYILYPEILQYFNFLEDPSKPVIFKTLNNEEVSVTPIQYRLEESEMINIFDQNNSPLPLTYKNIYTRRYWFEYLNDEKLMYIQVNSISDESKEYTFKDFFSELVKEIKNNEVEKLVLDLRWNGGGNDPLYRPVLSQFIYALEESDLNQKDKFFTVIGRYTASAAQHLVNDLEYLTNTTFIGEPTKQNVHFFSDTRRFSLPQSGFVVGAASGWLQNYVPSPYEERMMFKPEIAIPVLFRHISTNQDSVLNYIIGQ